jgi:hypothetical protein
MKRWMTGVAGLALPWWSWAHEGHGMPGSSHWHVADAWGFALAIGVVAVLIWWSGRDR